MHFPIDDLISKTAYETQEQLEVLISRKTTRLHLLFDATLECLFGPSWQVSEKFFGFTRKVDVYTALSGNVHFLGSLSTGKDSKDDKAVNKAILEIQAGINIEANRAFLKSCLEGE